MTLKRILAVLRKALGRTPKPTPTPAPPGPAPVPPPAPIPSPGDGPAELLAEHNARRAEAGLPAFVPNVKLQMAAQSHADTMARTGQMAHSGIGDGDLGSRLTGVAYRSLRAGENVAWGQRSVAGAMASWMGSPGHRANILGGFTEGGFAMSSGANGPFWCAVFGSPAIRASVAVALHTYTMGTPEVIGDGRVAASSVTLAANGS
jgi:uncharacterized protein YkwD